MTESRSRSSPGVRSFLDQAKTMLKASASSRAVEISQVSTNLSGMLSHQRDKCHSPQSLSGVKRDMAIRNAKEVDEPVRQKLCLRMAFKLASYADGQTLFGFVTQSCADGQRHIPFLLFARVPILPIIAADFEALSWSNGLLFFLCLGVIAKLLCIVWSFASALLNRYTRTEPILDPEKFAKDFNGYPGIPDQRDLFTIMWT